MGSPSKGKSLKEQKQFKENAKRMETDQKKIKRAEKNLRIFFLEIKKILDKNDDEVIYPANNYTVYDAKQKVKDRKLIRFLYDILVGTTIIGAIIDK